MFVAGEAGIGKTTVVEHFLAHTPAAGAVRIGRGYCVEQTEQGEAYLPVLQAVQHLCQAPGGEQVIAILRRYAPWWLLQLSGVIEADELERLHCHVHGSSPQRRVRELAQALTALAAESPVILFFDDLHWGDAATLDFIAYLAQSREPTRLLVLSTYRPAEAILNGSSLRRVVQSLVGRGQAQELALELFTQPEVKAYLIQRLGRTPLVEVVSPVIHRCTEGNALFVMHYVDYLLQQGLLVEADGGWELGRESRQLEQVIPDHVHQLLIKQIEGLSSDRQRLLAVASVVGLTFTAREVGAVLNCPLEAIEAVYDELAAQGQFLETQGLAEWPDGVITVRYQFRHILYRRALYHRIGLAQRVRWQRQFTEHFARVEGERGQEMSGEGAFHCERGQEYQRALLVWHHAAEHVLRLRADPPALGHGQARSPRLPPLPARAESDHRELPVCQPVSVVLVMSRGATVERLLRALYPYDGAIDGGKVPGLPELPSGCWVGDNTNAVLGGLLPWENARSQSFTAPRQQSGRSRRPSEKTTGA